MKKVLSIALVSTTALTALAATSQTAQAAVQLDSNHVQVEAGDTYKSIAANTGVTIAELEQANGREVGGFDLIFPGETVTLPGATTTASTTDAQQTVTPQTNVEQTSNQETTTQTQSTTQAQTQAVTQSASETQTTSTSTTTGTSQGTFKISFYDPAVLGSNMGYGGVAANLSVFPKVQHLRSHFLMVQY